MVTGQHWEVQSFVAGQRVAGVAAYHYWKAGAPSRGGAHAGPGRGRVVAPDDGGGE